MTSENIVNRDSLRSLLVTINEEGVPEYMQSRWV